MSERLDNLDKVMRWALTFDPAVVRAEVEVLHARYPSIDQEDLGRKIYTKQAWKAAAMGFVTGLPGNLLVALPAGAADAIAMLRLEATAAVKVATLYEPTYLDSHEPQYELLVPIFGAGVVSQALREAGVLAGRQATKALIRKYLARGTLKTFQSVMVKAFGKKVLQRTLITKTVPIVGGVIGGSWNWIEIKLQGRRVIRYFADGDSPDDVEPPW